MAISDARHRANEKYNAKAYDEIKVRVSKGRKAELQAAADRHGQSVNGLINSLIDAWMERERDGAVPGDTEGRQRPGDISIFPDSKAAPASPVGVSPTPGSESSPAERTEAGDLPF